MDNPLLLSALQGKLTERIPVWFMRQAGRYLPEYMKLRSGYSNFLEFCYTPDAATEVTLQPIERFGFDAAILFSDILVIPDALGQEVRFVKGEGPKLGDVDFSALSAERVQAHLQPVMQAIKQIRTRLPSDKTLIGFSGAPWTLACYMLEGQGSRDFQAARQFAHSEPEAFAQLMTLLERSIADYCCWQIEAGAQVIQLFDSWAGVVPAAQFDAWVSGPAGRISAAIKAAHPDVPIIGFAKGAGGNLLPYAQHSDVDALGIDQQTSLSFARNIAKRSGKVLQGNLDNVTLASDKAEAVRQTHAILESWRDVPFIFNLGHGILPHTPIEHVEAVLSAIREFKR